MVLEILLGSVVGVLIREIRDRRQRRRGFEVAQLNHFDHDLILPPINDPDWNPAPGPCHEGWTCIRQNMVMGKIRTCMDHGVIVNDMSMDCTSPHEAKRFIEYACAVRRSVLDRIIQESSEGTRWKRLEEIVDKQPKIG